jgi:hypothetical protein
MEQRQKYDCQIDLVYKRKRLDMSFCHLSFAWIKQRYPLGLISLLSFPGEFNSGQLAF